MSRTYTFHCNSCGFPRPHRIERHGSGEYHYRCLYCHNFTLAKPTRKKDPQLKLPLKNPASRQSEIKKAMKLATDFSGHRPKKLRRVPVSPASNVRFTAGTVTGIIYLARRDGKVEEYLHRFASGSRPSLIVSPDGKRLELLGGAFRFTERGIVDRKVKTITRNRKH